MSASRIIVTLATLSHVPFARALASSVKATNPNVPVYLLLIDADRTDRADEPFTIITLAQLPDQVTIRQMAFYYSAFEFCNALKGHLSQYVLQTLGADQWLYLDSDIMVCGSLAAVWSPLEAAPIVLTPHCTKPMPGASGATLEAAMIKHGIYNGGLMGLRRCDETTAFLGWFTNRLSRTAFYDDKVGTFVDQTWLSLIPCLFESTAICRHPGVNIGHWNLHERQLNEQGTTANGQPILCVHFSGWDFNQPAEVSPKFSPAYLRPAPLGWVPIGHRYREMLAMAGYSQGSRIPYRFACFSDGREITPRMRKGLLKEIELGTAPSDPFAAGEHFFAAYPRKYAGIRRLLPSSVQKWASSKLGR